MPNLNDILNQLDQRLKGVRPNVELSVSAEELRVLCAAARRGSYVIGADVAEGPDKGVSVKWCAKCNLPWDGCHCTRAVKPEAKDVAPALSEAKQPARVDQSGPRADQNPTRKGK